MNHNAEINMDIQNINIPNIIKTNQYDRLTSSIKNYEETLQKLLANDKDTEMTKLPYTFIWKTDTELFPNFRDEVKKIGLELFGEEFNNFGEDIVITGPFVRSCLISDDSNQENSLVKIIKELYFYRCGSESWDQIIDTSIFVDKKTEFVLEDETKKIFLVKKKYKHPSHVILHYKENLKRVGYCNGSYYVSSMFLIEIQKHFPLLNSKFKDPILNTPYDPLNIYTSANNICRTGPQNLIERIDFEELINLPKKSFTKLFNFKTCIELCLDKIMTEDHPVIVHQLSQIILFLGGIKIKRPPIFYAMTIGIQNKNAEIYEYIKRLDNYYEIEINDELLKNFNDNYCAINMTNPANKLELINNFMIEQIIKSDKYSDLEDYLLFTKLKINKNMIDLAIKNNSNSILEKIAENKNMDKHLIYYLILMSENFELTNLIGFEMSVDIAMNYVKEILANGKIRSFVYLYDLDTSVMSTLFDNNQNILHCIRPSGNYSDLTELIIKIKPELLNLKDCNKETPVMFHAKHNPEIVKVMLGHKFDYTLVDNDGNTFLHNLCRNDCPSILKIALKKCPELIDMPNKKSETPMIICGKNNKENMFYVLKGMGADTLTKDSFGNTVFHYICANSMCLGTIIENTENYFNLKPIDYCKVSQKYYTFV